MSGQALNTQRDFSVTCNDSTVHFCSNSRCKWPFSAEVFSRLHCVNTSSRLREWLHDLATRCLFDLVGPTRSSSAENKRDYGKGALASRAEVNAVPTCSRNMSGRTLRAMRCDQSGWLHVPQVQRRITSFQVWKKGKNIFSVHRRAFGIQTMRFEVTSSHLLAAGRQLIQTFLHKTISQSQVL